MSKLIIITGTSGCGKSTLIRALLKQKNISLSISYTTREKRVNEINHTDYHFVTEEEFMKLKNAGAFYEITFYDNHYYGTAKSELTKNEIVLVDCDIKGAALEFQEFDTTKIFLYNTKEVIYKRLMERYKDEEKVKRRMKSYEVDMSGYKDGNYDYGFITDDLEKNMEKLKKIIFC